MKTPRRWPLAVGGLVAAVLIATMVLLWDRDQPWPAPPAAPVPAAAIPPPAAPNPADKREEPGMILEVPAIGVRTGPIVNLGLQPDGALQVPQDARTTGWYTGSPVPGETGPSVLAAHVDYRNVPGTFARLKELTAGAEAVVSRPDGTAAAFQVYRVEHYPKSAFPTDRVYGDTPGPELRLITCGGEFDPAAASYRDNVVAYAKLTRFGPA